MQFSKVAFGSVLVGLLILAGIWYFAFQSPDVMGSLVSMGVYAVVGGLVWVGLVLAILGILMIVV